MVAEAQAYAKARYWEAIPGGRVRCLLCPNHCRLSEGHRGACFVRMAQGGEMVLTTYGRSSGFCIDPIEKKPLNHFLPGTAVLSFGTAGCNLACRFCQNWDISKSREMDILASYAGPDEIARAALAHGCPSVAFTYNDPIIFLEYAVDIAQACHAAGLKTVAVTAGYMCAEPRVEFFSHMDAANVDLKGFTDKFYKEICGGHLDPVKETLLYLRRKTKVWLEITTLLIPGYNDSDAELEQLTKWVADALGSDVPLHFTAFHPDYKMLEVPMTPLATLRRARAIAMRNGLRYVYVGNLPDREGSATFCPQCSKALIERDGYDVVGWNLDPSGRCPQCGSPVAGVFEKEPGHWGSRRTVVRVA